MKMERPATPIKGRKRRLLGLVSERVRELRRRRKRREERLKARRKEAAQQQIAASQKS